jgi:threonine dehydrogenase-like Zn-dependent dehydrogenase
MLYINTQNRFRIKMKALIVKDIDVIEITNIPIPTPSKDELLLKIDYCGVCKTDAKIVYKGHRDLHLPRVPGHECCGHSEDGRFFLIWPGVACENCKLCKSEKSNLCSDMQIIGFHRNGGMAEYMTAPKNSLIELDKNFPIKLATFAEPLGCAINALEQFTGTNGNLLIIGAGTCGILMALAAKNMGFSTFILENNRDKFAKAEKILSNNHIDEKSANYAEIKLISKLSDIDNYFYAVNATSSEKAFHTAINSIAPSGEFVFFSGLSANVKFNSSFVNQIHYRQLVIKGAYGCTKKQMKTALKIIDKNQQTIKLLIEKTISLDKTPAIFNNVANGQYYRYIIDLKRKVSTE